MPKAALALLLLVTPALGQVHLEGKTVQGGLLFGKSPPGSKMTLDGEPLLLSTDGHFVIGFSREQTAAQELVARLPDGRLWRKTLNPEPRQFEIQRVDGLPPETVTPDPSVLERIREEAELARRARERRDDRSDWTGGFIWPAVGPITGVYGSQRILNGEPRAPHWGIDIAASAGTPVLAPARGLVTLTHPDMYFSGGTILIDHGLGLTSAFLHLSAIHVEAGQWVEQGTIIGEIGATGRATGPHLDWRMNWGEIRVDPQLLLPPLPDEDEGT